MILAGISPGTPPTRGQPPRGKQKKEEGCEAKRQRPSPLQELRDRPGSYKRSRFYHQGVGAVGLSQLLEGEAQPEAEPQPSVGVLRAA
jgi:hypothetical protein